MDLFVHENMLKFELIINPIFFYLREEENKVIDQILR